MAYAEYLTECVAEFGRVELAYPNLLEMRRCFWAECLKGLRASPLPTWAKDAPDNVKERVALFSAAFLPGFARMLLEQRPDDSSIEAEAWAAIHDFYVDLIEEKVMPALIITQDHIAEAKAWEAISLNKRVTSLFVHTLTHLVAMRKTVQCQEDMRKTVQ
jgi:hypothetical protein